MTALLKNILIAVSLMVVGGAAYAQQACFYEHVQYGGQRFCVGAGQQINDMQNYFNDTVSSLTVPQGLSVVACEHIHFGGHCVRFQNNQSNLVNIGFNDTISSIRVEWAQHQPPVGGPAVKMLAQVQVGCQGRVEQVTLENFTLFQNDGSYLHFRSTVQTPHKCDGKTRFIGADAVISIHRNNAKVSQSGVLLSPAVNARIRCDGRTAWLNAPCLNATLTH